MVLLIPAAVKRLKKAGKDEGLAEGVVKGRDEERARIQEILDRLDNGLSPEAIEELKCKLFGQDPEE